MLWFECKPLQLFLFIVAICIFAFIIFDVIENTIRIFFFILNFWKSTNLILETAASLYLEKQMGSEKNKIKHKCNFTKTQKQLDDLYQIWRPWYLQHQAELFCVLLSEELVEYDGCFQQEKLSDISQQFLDFWKENQK